MAHMIGTVPEACFTSGFPETTHIHGLLLVLRRGIGPVRTPTAQGKGRKQLGPSRMLQHQYNSIKAESC